MIRQSNPYNAVAFYATDADEAHRGYLHSPVSILPPFQFSVNDETETVASWKMRNVESGVEFTQTLGQIAVSSSATSGKAWFTYTGATLSNAPTPGLYQIIVTLTGGDVYYSQRLMMSRIFDTFGAMSLVFNDGDCVTDPGGTVFSLPFTATFGTWGTDRVLLDANATGDYVFISTLSDFSLTNDDIGEFGGAPVIRIETTTVLPNEPGAVSRVYRDYVFTWSEGDPCGGILTGSTAVAEYGQDMYVLAFTNTTDLTDLNLLYQTGYTQKFYFFGYRLEHVPVIEEAFETNGVGERFLAQATNREAVAFDFWPMPDYLQAVLQAADQHGTVTLSRIGGTAETIYEVDVERKDVTNAVCPAGLLRFTSAPVAVQGCEGDFDLD
jgi:hypothetical protein